MGQKSIGSFIAELRKEKRMTQMELAERLGVSDKAISRWERDESAPDISLLLTIADIFSITTDELLKGKRNTDIEESVANEATVPPNIKLTKYIIYSSVSASIAFVALLAALDARFNFIFGRYNFILSCIFYLISFIGEIILTVNEFTSVKSKKLLKKIFRISSITSSFIIITALISIPLIITKSFTVWLKYAIVITAVTAVICYIISKKHFSYFNLKGELGL